MDRAFEPAVDLGKQRVRVVVVGDLQRTSPLELWRDRNDEERARVLAEARRLEPDLLVLLGDLVHDAGSPRAWADFDDATATLRAARIPVAAVPGNHDRARSVGRAPFAARVRVHPDEGAIALRAGPLGLLLLDTDARGARAWARVIEQAEACLAELEADETILGVAAFGHHPPRTNALLVRGSPRVARDVVPMLCRTPKCVLLVSGHVHAYERFAEGRLALVVAGNAGGPRHRIGHGPNRDLAGGAPLRDFGLLVLEAGPEGLSVEARALRKGEGAMTHRETLRCQWGDPLHEARKPGTLGAP